MQCVAKLGTVLLRKLFHDSASAWVPSLSSRNKRDKFAKERKCYCR